MITENGIMEILNNALGTIGFRIIGKEAAANAIMDKIKGEELKNKKPSSIIDHDEYMQIYR